MDEVLAILNEDGLDSGKSATKAEIYKNGYWYRTVHIWILNDKQELLMQKRNPLKKTFPNLWALSTAGHVLYHESSKEAAVRELKEELGLNVSSSELEYLFTLKREQFAENTTLRVFDDVYLLSKNIDISNVKLQTEELTEIKYIHYKCLQSILKDKDPNYVPFSEEHEKLFAILNSRYK